jgi:thiamine biosynthesis lipoprotein
LCYNKLDRLILHLLRRNFVNANKPSPYKIPLILLSILLAITVAALIAIWVIFGGNAQQSEESYETTGFAMGTLVTQTVYGGDTSTQKAAAAAATQAVADLDSKISWREEDSDIQNLNNSDGETAISVSEETAEILATALDLAEQTDGAYDPTILPVSLLWNFDEGGNTVPSQTDIETYTSFVDYRQLTVDTEENTAQLLGEHSAIDLGAIGKGAGCDVAVEAYRESGADHAIVAVGGSVGVYGTKADGSPWRIGIRNPNSDDASSTMGTISISEGFVSTSGTYERMFEQDGVTYHHILDPKTGYPADSGLVSVTVYCQNGALSDGLSTACLVLGVEDALPLLSHYGAGAVFITTENEVIITENLKENVEVTSDEFTTSFVSLTAE